MHLGLLTTSFPRHPADVAGQFVLGFARALCERGHTLEVLAPEPVEPAVAPVAPRAQLQITHVPYLRPRALQRTFYGAGVPDNLRRDPFAWLGLAPFCANLLLTAQRRAPRWDALISHWALPSALVAGSVRGVKRHIAVLHSADIHLLGRLPGRVWLAQRIARESDALWFVTRAQRDRFLALLPPRTELPLTIVQPMGIDLPRAQQLDPSERERFRRRHGLQGFCVLLLGRLVPIKGVDVALRAAAMGGMTLLIAGAGPEQAALMGLARRLAVPVKWLGVVDGEDKHRWLCAADAFALPSRRLANGRSEGLPCALLEAVSYGLPVAASRLDGIAELFEDTVAPDHRLVPPDDPRALHAALLELRASAQPARDGSDITTRYSWKYVGAQIGAVLEQHR